MVTLPGNKLLAMHHGIKRTVRFERSVPTQIASQIIELFEKKSQSYVLFTKCSYPGNLGVNAEFNPEITRVAWSIHT